MKLELDPIDLKSEHQKTSQAGDRATIVQGCATSAVTFEKLTDNAQAAVRIVGRAIFYPWDRRTYNAVYTPK